MKTLPTRTVSSLAHRLTMLGVKKRTLLKPIMRGLLEGKVLITIRRRGKDSEITVSPANRKLMERLSK